MLKVKETTTYIPWRERAFVSIGEAAEIFARSPTWVRERILDGHLSAYQLTPAAPLDVSVESIIHLQRSAIPASPKVLASLRARVAREKRTAAGPILRLVINNDA